nr:MAG TPA: hypothetical protein [Caudoviricetes sp.]
MLALPSFYALGGLNLGFSHFWEKLTIPNLSNSPPEVNRAPSRQKYTKTGYSTP